MNKELIYLDHAAATPVDARVVSAMQPYFTKFFYNPSSPYEPAVEIRHHYEDAKHDLAVAIGAKPGEIIITAGATESINLAFNCVDGHVVVPSIEHHAVLECAKKHKHTLVRVDARGLVSAESIKSAITAETQLVSVALANNEIGTIQPIRDIAAVVKNERASRLSNGNGNPIYFHCDASQGVGQLDVNVARLGVDMLTLNSGKMYGPKQVGLLWCANHVVIKPLIVGGGQERGMRSGTENVAGVIGFAKALSLAMEHREHESKRLQILRDKMQSILVSEFPGAVVSGHKKHRLASHLHMSFPGVDGERLVFLLDNRGVLVATGSACAANKGTRSHVLNAIGLSANESDGSLRMTFGHLSTDENTEIACKVLVEEIKGEYKRVGK
jgi:cysteine desulfurase